MGGVYSYKNIALWLPQYKVTFGSVMFLSSPSNPLTKELL